MKPKSTGFGKLFIGIVSLIVLATIILHAAGELRFFNKKNVYFSLTKDVTTLRTDGKPTSFVMSPEKGDTINLHAGTYFIKENGKIVKPNFDFISGAEYDTDKLVTPKGGRFSGKTYKGFQVETEYIDEYGKWNMGDKLPATLKVNSNIEIHELIDPNLTKNRFNGLGKIFVGYFIVGGWFINMALLFLTGLINPKYIPYFGIPSRPFGKDADVESGMLIGWVMSGLYSSVGSFICYLLGKPVSELRN